MEPFLLARNPDPDSSLPYLVRLPIEGIVLKTRESWPRANRSYCHPADEWPDDAEILEEDAGAQCRRRGSAIDLVLHRRANYSSQFVFTRSRGRDMIFWQTGEAHFRHGRLSGLPAKAVVEDRYTSLFEVEHVEPGWLPELVARFQGALGALVHT
ncbi:MAG: hypothetical protein ACRDX9_16880 [Acidimicrobiia bacterium]